MLRILAPAAALVLLNAGADRLAFAPESDLELTKRFQVSIYQELDDLSILVDGQDMADMLGDIEFSLGVDTTVEIVDTYVRSGDGRPLKLKRLYDEILLETSLEYVSEFDSGEESQTTESDLEGETVIFQWDGEEGAYTADLETGEANSLLLEGLIEDMDLRALLPPGDVDVDDEWKIDADDLGPILAPGGSLGLFDQDMDEEAMEFLETITGSNYDELIDSIFDGEIVCTYKGVHDADGREVATVEVRIDIDSSTDLVEYLLSFLDTMGDGPPDDFDLSAADLGITVEGTGLFEWDVAAGHFHHFEAHADTAVTFHLIAESAGQGGEITVELSGDVEITSDVER